MPCEDHSNLGNFCRNCGERHSYDNEITVCKTRQHFDMKHDFCIFCGISREKLIEIAKEEFAEIIKDMERLDYIHINANVCQFATFVDLINRDNTAIPTKFYMNELTKKVESIERIYQEFPNLRQLNSDDIFANTVGYKITGWLYSFNIDLDDVGVSEQDDNNIYKNNIYRTLDEMNKNIVAMNDQKIQTKDIYGNKLSYDDRIKMSDLYESISDERQKKKQKIV